MDVEVLKEALLFCYMELLYSPFIIQLMEKKKLKSPLPIIKRKAVGFVVFFWGEWAFFLLFCIKR